MMNSIPFSIVQIIFLSFSFISTCVLSPVCFFYCRRLHQLRRIPFFAKRSANLMIFCPLITTVQMAMQITSELPHVFPSLFRGIAPRYLVHWRMYGGNIVFAAEVIRLWFLFLNYTKGIQTITRQWADSVHQQNGSSWALSKKTWFTPRSNVLYYIACAWIFSDNAFCAIVLLLRQENLIWCVHLSALFAGLGILVLSCKVRHAHDHLNIRTEFQYLGIIALATIATVVTIDCTFAHASALKSTVRIVCFTLISAPFYYISTKWVIDQYELRMAENVKRTKHAEHCQRKVSLHGIFADKDYFDLFAQHLVREFSIENLLFLLDVTHFKAQCVKAQFVESDADAISFTFARTVTRPNSEVTDAISFLENLCYIHQRYIAQSAEYPINIPYTLRADFKSVYTPYSRLFAERRRRVRPRSTDPTNLAIYLAFSENERPSVVRQFVDLLNSAVTEITRLMQLDSLLRFRSSQEYLDCWHRKHNDARKLISPIKGMRSAFDILSVLRLKRTGKEEERTSAVQPPVQPPVQVKVQSTSSVGIYISSSI